MNRMTTSTQLRRLIATAILGALASGFAGVSAADDSGARSTTVKYRDLNLSNRHAAAAPHGRIVEAAYVVCHTADIGHWSRPAVPLARGGQLDHRIVDSFIGELEAAEVRTDGYPRFEIEVRSQRFFRIHVLRGHERARLVRADQQQCAVDDAEPAADVAKVPPISGIARKEKRPVGRPQVKSAP